MGLLRFVKSADAKSFGATETAPAPPEQWEQEAGKHGLDVVQVVVKPAGKIVFLGSGAATEEAEKIKPATVRGEPGIGTSKLARAFPWVTGLVGLLVAVAAAMHTVLSIRKAYLQRGGYNSRLSEMLWIGWTSFVLGMIMVLGARALRRRSATAFWLCTGAAAVFLVCTAILAPVQPGFYSGLPIYGGYLLLAAVVRAEVTRAANGSSAL